MNATDPKFDPTPMPRLASVAPAGRYTVTVSWSQGPRAGITETVDLAPLIEQFRLYAPLRGNQALFDALGIVDGGVAIEWADGEIDMAATSVERLAAEQMTGQDFAEFLKRNRLTRQAAAAELGRSLRAVQDYVKSTGPIPRIVALACKGYEASR
ncbi:hypothetical protein H2509_08045 [Stappia sp. F7233]|uniref:DUF2442 domain-containing protein n=1 Tax=Stappia albiluteola TaxID=2758565 RepID=A0A839ABL8_9HYPH|nr:hypothetical protein [Stappia albiluteola]MBA5777080.1 hypothetical protein [Stappia albiluteola]